MKKKLARIFCISLAMVFCLCIGALAASNLEAISAYLNRGITIKLDGQTQVLKNEQGNQVYPISYNGTTYVPIRGVSSILGVGVDWDNNTKTVLLTSKGSGSTANTVKPYEIKNGKVFDGTSAEGFTVSGQKYNNGFKLTGMSISNQSYALFNTSGKSTLSFDVGHIDGTGDALLDLGIYLNDSYVKTVDVTATQGVRHVEIDLRGANVVKLHFLSEAGYFSGEYGFFNVQLT